MATLEQTTRTRRRPGVDATHPHYKWWALSCTSLGMRRNTMIAALVLVIGPVAGGALVAIDWPWVFWFNVPLGIAGSVWAALNLHEMGSLDKNRTLDVTGTASYVVGLTALVYAI